MKIRFARSAGPLLAAFLAALVVGCAPMAPTPDVPPLNGTAWVLSALPGHTLRPDAAATLSFEAGRAQGSDGCNRFGIPYTTKGSTIDLSGTGMSTQMGCPPEVMKQAGAFMDALRAARTYRVANGQLQLLGADGAVRATLAAQSTRLAGTTWKVTGINNGRNALVSTVGGSTVTMAFATDGKVAGSAGCNQYTSRYEVEGSKFRFSVPAATRRMCADAGVMEQEQAFLKALDAVRTLRMEGSRIEFRDDQGALQVTASRESSG
jgi:heat shock protein HslJ